jgi:hypothetical protein
MVAIMAKMGMSGSFAETEDGLIWDMLGLLGLMLKGNGRSAILPGSRDPKVLLTGVSQSSIALRTWATGFHDLYRTQNGAPAYDGYLAVVGPAQLRINQCADDVPLDDPRQKIPALDVPFISISSEGEMWMARHTRQPDSFTGDRGIVSYEVAGASHFAGEVPGLIPDPLVFAPIEDIARAGARPPGAAGGFTPAGLFSNDFVWAPLIRGAYANLRRWVHEGVRPPRAEGIALDGNLEIRRDTLGNAIGGVRMPYVDVPTASHKGYLSAGGLGGIMGSKEPLAAETLTELYPDRTAYLAKFAAATDRLVRANWISRKDAESMKLGAATASPPT